jgi:excisionase family DNA binding protein
MAERTIYMWAQNGKVPAFKLGASWRFRKSEIDAWLETQRTGPVMGEKPLVEVEQVPPTRSEITAQERIAREAKIEACITYIRQLMLNDDRSIWLVSEIEDLFDEKTSTEAIKRLSKSGVLQEDRQEDARGRKIPVIKRSD